MWASHHTARSTRVENLASCTCYWVVSLVLGHLDPSCILSCQNIVGAVATHLQIRCSEHSAHICVFVLLCQLLTSRVLFVAHWDQIVGSTALILLACVIKFNFGLKTLSFRLISLCKHFITVSITTIALLPQRCIVILFLFPFLLASALISNREVLIETITVYTVKG